MLFYFHGGDAPLWAVILWIFIIPAFLVALVVWLLFKFKVGEPPKKDEEKVSPLLFSLDETKDKESK